MVSIVLIFIITILNTIFNFPLGFLNTTLSSQSQENLFFSLFGVQATISVLSISIIAIITGFQNTRIFGISIINYVTEKRPKVFKHKRLMIIDLLITLLNFFVVSKEYYNISIYLFFLSIVISCVLIYDTSFIFKNESDIEAEIKDYVLQNYDENYLRDFEVTIMDFSKSMSITNLEHSLEMIFEIFKKEISNTNGSDSVNPQKHHIIIQNIVSKVFNETYNYSNKKIPLFVLEVILDMYKCANENNQKNASNNVYLNIWENIETNYYNFVVYTDLETIGQTGDFTYFSFYNEIVNNCSYLEDRIYKYHRRTVKLLEYSYGLEKYYTRLSFAINKNPHADKKIYIKILSNASNNLRINNLDDRLKRIYLIDLLNLFKYYIEIGETDILYNYFYEELLCFENDDSIFVFLSSLVFLYYAGFCEPLYDGNIVKDNARKMIDILNNSFYNINYFDSYNNVIPENFDRALFLIITENFEYWGEVNSKYDTITPAIQKVWLFYGLKTFFGYERLQSWLLILTKNLSDYSIYFDKENKFHEFFNKISKDITGLETNDYYEDENRVREILENDSKKKLLETIAEHQNINQEIIDLKRSIEEFVVDECNRFNIFNNNLSTDTSILRGRKHVIMSSIDVKNISTEFSLEKIKNGIQRVFIYELLGVINENVEHIEKKNSDRDKQDSLIKSSMKFNPNVYIGKIKDFYNENSKKDLLKEFIGEFNTFSGVDIRNTYYLINSKLLCFRIKSFNFEICDYQLDEIIHYFKPIIKSDTYYFNPIRGDILIPFTKEELLDFCNKYYKKCQVTFDIEYAFGQEKIGSSMRVVFK